VTPAEPEAEYPVFDEVAEAIEAHVEFFDEDVTPPEEDYVAIGQHAEAAAESAFEIEAEAEPELVPQPEPEPVPAPEPADEVLKWTARLRAGEQFSTVMEEMSEYAGSRSGEIAEQLSGWTDNGNAQELSPEEAGLSGFCAAFLLKTAGRAGAAINILEWSVRRKSNSAEPYRLLGDLYYAKGLFIQALESYRKIREIKGDMAELTGPWLRCLKEAGDWDTLLAETERLPIGNDVGLALARAEAVRQKGRAGEAFKMIEKIMQAAESPEDKVRCSLFMAKALESKGDIIGATDYYEKCFEIDPANPEAHYELGRLYLKHNAIPLAKNQLMTILKKFPESEWADKSRNLMAKEGVL
jgi:tetratricopeptide (TPR) repeat protein